MRIVLLGPYYPFRGGISDTNQELFNSLIKKGHKVYIIDFKLLYPKLLFPGKNQYEENYKFFKSKKIINSINPINWFFVAKKINKLKPDLIISSYWTGFLSPCLTIINKLIDKKFKKIGIIHNSISHEKRFFEKILLKFYLNNIDKFFTLSQNVQNQINKICSYSKGETLFHPIPEKYGERVEKSIAKQKLNLKENFKYILFFGLIRKYKGLDLLIKSMPLVLENNPEIKLLIAGENYESINKYTSLISELGISDKIILKNDFIKSKEVKYWFSASDIIVLPYKSASQSGVIPLSIKFKVPIVGTKIEGIKEIIEKNNIGFLAEKDSSSISNKINYVLKDQNQKIIANMEKINKKLSWNNFTKELLKKI